MQTDRLISYKWYLREQTFLIQILQVAMLTNEFQKFYFERKHSDSLERCRK